MALRGCFNPALANHRDSPNKKKSIKRAKALKRKHRRKPKSLFRISEIDLEFRKLIASF